MVYKFKKGDRVRILDGSTIKNYTYGWAPDMRNYVGYEVTIQSFNSDENNRPSYYLDDIPYKWDERGLLLIDSEDDNIKNVIFNDPATIVLWEDGTKTVVKCQDGDTYSKELGLAMCISKKYLGNKGNFNEVFKKWIPDEKPFTEEELIKIVANIDFSKFYEGLSNALYNIGKVLVETYKPEDPVENTPEKDGNQVEEVTPETEDDISIEKMRTLIRGYCVGRYCTNCELHDVPCHDSKMTDEDVRVAYRLIKKSKKEED